jgi:hypothetical protein
MDPDVLAFRPLLLRAFIEVDSFSSSSSSSGNGSAATAYSPPAPMMAAGPPLPPVWMFLMSSLM